jgi:hypothetical protein
VTKDSKLVSKVKDERDEMISAAADIPEAGGDRVRDPPPGLLSPVPSVIAGSVHAVILTPLSSCTRLL